MGSSNINTGNTTATTTGVVGNASNEAKPLTKAQQEKATKEAEKKAKAIQDAKMLLEAEAKREAEEQAARNEEARKLREADAKKTGLSSKDIERGVINEFFRGCENDQQKRKKINDLFINLSSETRIKIISKRGKAIESAKVANESFLALTFQEAFKAIKHLIAKESGNELDKNVNKKLSESLGLISQFRIIKETTTNEQFKRFLIENFEDTKSHFCIYGFMTFSELIAQIKNPGKFEIKFIKDFEEGKVKDSLSYKLFKNAFNKSLTQREDFKNLMQRGKEFNEILKMFRNVEILPAFVNEEAINLILSKFVKIKDLNESQLRAIYNLSFSSYLTFELNTIFENETKIFEAEEEFNQFSTELKAELKARLVLKKVKPTTLNALELYRSDLEAEARKQSGSEEENEESEIEEEVIVK